MSEAFRVIREAHKRCIAHAEWVRTTVPGYYIGSLEQLSHGVTDAALAAWHDVRISFKNAGVVVVGGVLDYPVKCRTPGLVYPTVEEPALYIKDATGRIIYLTGCSWGYGGEGPHGTAVILADIGFRADGAKRPTIEDVMRFVAGLPMRVPWRREL